MVAVEHRRFVHVVLLLHSGFTTTWMKQVATAYMDEICYCGTQVVRFFCVMRKISCSACLRGHHRMKVGSSGVRRSPDWPARPGACQNHSVHKFKIHRSNVIKEFGKCSRLSTSVWGARRNRTVIMHDWKVALNNCRSDLGLTEGFHTQEKICNDPEVYYEIIACMRKKEPDSLRHKNATEKAKIESLMRCYKKAYQKYKEIIMK
ncbi:uncharacterized protein LOC135400854 isoform X1 [Ornithodoros turicata]|uniref:uncharacterized protein LOC135400854 isoform X1 n=1 Tax=Ornithodoros turicata TaxID=34597 RepID=UPI00313A475D